MFGDESYRDFFQPNLLGQETEQTFEAKIFALDKNDQTYEAKKKYLERKREEDLDAVDSFGKKRTKIKKF